MMPDIAVHIVGAGLAGLGAATKLASRGFRVVLHEASGQAGGRCRSFEDAKLGCRIDNGNHLLLSGNRSALAYLDLLGARDRLVEVKPAALPFMDLRTGATWTIRPNAGPLPWWVLARSRRCPGSSAVGHLAALRMLVAPAHATVRECLGAPGPLYEALWTPIAVSALNLAPEMASARLLGAVFAATLLRGEASCRPLIARDGLEDCFVEPALAFLRRGGATIAAHHRLRGMRFDAADGHVTALRFASGDITLTPRDMVVLAVPPAQAADLLPGLPVPEDGPPIVNAHFRLGRPVPLPGGLPLLALVGGTAEWLFARSDVISVTVSAADALARRPGDEIAATLWADVARATGTGGPMPAVRIVKERRATFLQTPASVARRPGARTHHPNLFLAGDWTDTGLPATIEGAVASGHRAAALVERAVRGTQGWFTRFHSSHVGSMAVSERS